MEFVGCASMEITEVLNGDDSDEEEQKPEDITIDRRMSICGFY